MLIRREHERLTGAASAVLGGIFAVAALAHATDGFTDDTARALPSVILGLVAGGALLVAAFGLLTYRYWGWKAGIGAHLFAIATVVIAILAVTAGYGDETPSLAVPAVLLTLLALNLVALWRTRPRNPLRRAQHEIAAKMY